MAFPLGSHFDSPEIQNLSKTAPGWSRFGSTFFLSVCDEERKIGYLFNEIRCAAWKLPVPEEKGVLL